MNDLNQLTLQLYSKQYAYMYIQKKKEIRDSRKDAVICLPCLSNCGKTSQTTRVLCEKLDAYEGK